MRRERKSLSALLEDAAIQWPAQHSPSPDEDAAGQARIHLAPGGRHGMENAWRFLRSGAVILGAIDDAELPAIHR